MQILKVVYIVKTKQMQPQNLYDIYLVLYIQS